MTKFQIDLYLDGYKTEEEQEKAAEQFIEDQLDFSGSSVKIIKEDKTPLDLEWLNKNGLLMIEQGDGGLHANVAFTPFEGNYIGIIQWNNQWQVIVENNNEEQVTIAIVETREDVIKLRNVLKI